MNKTLEQEINYVINPESETLLICTTKTTRLEIHAVTLLEVAATITDSFGNIYMKFSISFEHLTSEINHQMTEEQLYEKLKYNILRWVVFGKTGSTILSLQDAIKCARVLTYNKCH